LVKTFKPEIKQKGENDKMKDILAFVGGLIAGAILYENRQRMKKAVVKWFNDDEAAQDSSPAQS